MTAPHLSAFSDQRATLTVRTVAAVGVLLTVVGVLGVVAYGAFDIWFWDGDAILVLFSLFFGSFAWFIALRQPRNPIVWIMATAALSVGILEAGFSAGVLLYEPDVEILAGLIPANLPYGLNLIGLLVGWMWVPAMMPTLTFGLLVFPDGKLPSTRWHWTGVAAVIGMVTMAAGVIWGYRPSNTSIPEQGALVAAGAWILAPAALAGIFALLIRLRGASGEARQQTKWVLWGAAIFVPTMVVVGTQPWLDPFGKTVIVIVMAAEAVFLTSYGVAIAKYRLYDIDVVISRTFVYGTLALFITGLYVATVVGVGGLIGGEDPADPLISIGATVMIALAFQPLRRRLERIANRMVYGRRATPYEVLSTFSQRVPAVDPTVLTQIAQALVEGTTAEAAAIWMSRDHEMQRVAQWPLDTAETPSGRADDDSLVRTAEVIHDDEQLGLVTLSLRPGQPFTPVDAKVLEDVAAGLGLALRNLRLTEDLRAHLNQLRESRRRIVAVQDMTRRRLERDLHDGAQQRLVSMKIKLGIGATMASRDGFERTRGALDSLRDETDQTIEAVRDFARGIYPPLLEAEGLGPAIVAKVRTTEIPVTVQAAGIGRYSREVESTIYFCVLEAVDNALRHARARSILVTLDESEDTLGFEVRDDGVGFDPAATQGSSGLTNLADRLDALDGRLDIHSSPGKGTSVLGSLPISQPAAPR